MANTIGECHVVITFPIPLQEEKLRMHFIDNEVVKRHIEEMRLEVEQYRLERQTLNRKRIERKKLPFWTAFISFFN